MKRILILITAIIVPGVALACGMAWPPYETPAMIKAERVLIVWDAEKKREDFIRSVDFETKSEDLGFIVPVPSIPEVTDVRAQIFENLDNEMERQRPVKPKDPEMDGILGKSFGTGGAPGAVASARVVASFELENYQVKVLEANSIEPLAKWLKANKFELRLALKKWLTPYIEKKYYFTVFKFRKSKPSENFTSKAVQISFDTPEPYYPYRDSEDMVTSPDRHMLLYFLSDNAYKPDFLVDHAKLQVPKNWVMDYCDEEPNFIEKIIGKSARPMFSNKIPVKGLSKLQDDRMFAGDKPLNWLTVWEDKTEKRPDRDLSFVKYGNNKPYLLCPR